MGRRRDGEDCKLQLVNYEGNTIFDIDIGQVYEEPMIANFLGNIYPSNELDEVSKAVLKRGKMKGVSGKDIVSQPLQIQIEYGIIDADLTQDLATDRNCLVLGIMNEIAEFVGMSLADVCNSGPSTWWTSYYKNKMHVHPSRTAIKNTEGYKGGDVAKFDNPFECINLAVFDFKQQYPEIAKKYNISFDTVNCDCCKDDPTARLHTGQLDIDAKGYWTCRKRRGAYTRALGVLTELRDRYRAKYEEAAEKAGGNNKAAAHEYNVKQQAYKLFANAGYGVFGEPFFDYGDVRVAELITAFGRTKVNKLKRMIESEFPGLENIYRDTDSAFVIGIDELLPISKDNPIVKKIVQRANEPEDKGGIGIPLAYEKWYSKALIYKSKNYMAVDGDNPNQLIVKGLVGKKSNQCKLVREAFKQCRDYWKDGADTSIIEAYIKPIVESLDNRTVDIERLRERSKIGQDPITGYIGTPKRPEKVLGQKNGKRINESVSFWHKVKQSDGDYYFTEDPNEIDYAHYKEPLRTALKPILTVRGYSAEQIDELLKISSDIVRRRKNREKRGEKGVLEGKK